MSKAHVQTTHLCVGDQQKIKNLWVFLLVLVCCGTPRRKEFRNVAFVYVRVLCACVCLCVFVCVCVVVHVETGGLGGGAVGGGGGGGGGARNRLPLGPSGPLDLPAGSGREPSSTSAD